MIAGFSGILGLNALLIMLLEFVLSWMLKAFETRVRRSKQNLFLPQMLAQGDRAFYWSQTLV
jgi:hypothetical protein